MNAKLQSRHFHDVDELIEKALDALDEKSPVPPVSSHGSLHEFFMNSPLQGANLDLERVRDYPRAPDLE
jgi:hypothetical protein